MEGAASQSLVEFEVGGQRFTVSSESIELGPSSRLKQMYTSSVNNHQPIRIDRPPEMFGAILALYQTRELHIPMTSCPGAFLKELQYWNITTECLSECCFTRLQCFLDEQNTLKKFRESLHKFENGTPSKFCSCFAQRRSAVWKIVDYRVNSIPAVLYFAISLLMVLISIVSLAFGTSHNFQRSMTNCERLEYMRSANMDDIEYIEDLFEANCNNDTLPIQPTHRLRSHLNSDFRRSTDFVEIYVPIPPQAVEGSSSDMTATTDFLSSPHFLLGSEPPGKYIKIPNLKVKITSFFVLDAITTAFFTVDLIIRLFTCPDVFLYFTSIINIADAAALFATYIHMLILFLKKHHRYEDDWMDLLEYMQMLRSLRLFRLLSNVRAGRVLAYTVRTNVTDLLILVLFLIAGMCTFASIIYIAEETVEDIPHGWYWAVVTMTTVGYGDITPVTALGRFLSCACAICGVIMFAITIPLFANNFVTLYQYSGSVNKVKKTLKRNNWRPSATAPSTTAENVVGRTT